MPQEEEQKFYCPECNAEIDYLRYNSYVNEWGTYDLETEDMNGDDSETQETNYTCPECDANVTPDDVLDHLDDEDQEVELENTSAKNYNLGEEKEDGTRIIIESNSKISEGIEHTKTCKKCKEIMFNSSGEDFCKNCLEEKLCKMTNQ